MLLGVVWGLNAYDDAPEEVSKVVVLFVSGKSDEVLSSPNTRLHALEQTVARQSEQLDAIMPVLALATLPELAELGLNMLERRTVANICKRCCNAAMTQAHERLRAELPAAGVELSTAGVRQLLHAGI